MGLGDGALEFAVEGVREEVAGEGQKDGVSGLVVEAAEGGLPEGGRGVGGLELAGFLEGGKGGGLGGGVRGVEDSIPAGDGGVGEPGNLGWVVKGVEVGVGEEEGGNGGGLRSAGRVRRSRRRSSGHGSAPFIVLVVRVFVFRSVANYLRDDGIVLRVGHLAGANSGSSHYALLWSR